VVPLELPPLRERRADILPLLEHFFARFAASHGAPPPQLDPAAAEALCRHRWSGNVRELRNLCERLVILHGGTVIGMRQLPREVGSEAGGPPFRLPDSGIALEELERSLIGEALRKSGGNRSHAARLLGLSRDTLLYRLKKYAIA
jgi:DNA-binding NtrC family response regulator